MTLSNDNRIVLISSLVFLVFLAIVFCGFSAWVHFFKNDPASRMKHVAMQQKKQFHGKSFEKRTFTPEPKEKFKRFREEMKKRREYELKLRSDLVALLKKKNAGAAAISAAECDLAIAKIRMMARRRREGVSGAEFVVRGFYVSKAVPAVVDTANEESIRLALADIDMKKQMGQLRRFMASEEFKTAAENWKKEQSDENLKALCEAEKSVSNDNTPHRRGMK